MKPQQPIIFVGMHRSGTSMLGRILESAGLFVGARKDKNNEATFFLWLNSWLMAQCGARWDMPKAMHYLWQNEELLDWLEDYLRRLLDSPRAIQFLGWRRYMAVRGISRLSVPWGWKDPRNTFTLPLWLRIFPEAKVLVIERHGVDVAQSLRMRSHKGFDNTRNKYKRFRSAIFLRPKRGGFVESPRCASLSGGFSLWQEYIDQAYQNTQQLPGDRVLTLSYERVLENPASQIASALNFCGLDASNSRLKDLVAGFNSNRAYSYRSNPELAAFASDHRSELTSHGYG